MVEPEKMQKTMDNQPVNLILHGVVPPHGLTFGGVNGDGNVAQITFLRGRLPIGKGKDVGGMGFSEKPEIQRFDLPVVAEQDATGGRSELHLSSEPANQHPARTGPGGTISVSFDDCHFHPLPRPVATRSLLGSAAGASGEDGEPKSKPG